MLAKRLQWTIFPPTLKVTARGVCSYLPMAQLSHAHFGGYFSIKNFILKNRRLQPFYSFIFKDVSAV